jgi:hypothetical protein
MPENTPMARATVAPGTPPGQTTDDDRVEVPDPHLSWAAQARLLQERYRLVDDEEVDRLSEQVCGFHV